MTTISATPTFLKRIALTATVCAIAGQGGCAGQTEHSPNSNTTSTASAPDSTDSNSTNVDARPASSDASEDTPSNGEAATTVSRHQNADSHATPSKTFTNALADETSPYLLSHANNPVQWFPWGSDALKKAKEERKLIFLSIGYSSCHWCHVMERESFMDKEIAALLNKHFICIKVDREERPDIDSIYMTSLHVYNQLSGSGRGGGWPLSMFLTPERKPFFGGTYFPARKGDRGTPMGFLDIIQRVQQIWTTSADQISQDADRLTEFTKVQLEGRQQPISLKPLSKDMIVTLSKSLADQFDETNGGFAYNRQGPKFPEPSNLFFLLHQIRTSDDDANKRMLLETLDAMSRGGIRDHLGGGFHRYSVDPHWHIPHFEKMLYDNGPLTSVYAEAYSLTDNPEYKDVVDSMLTFVEREMLDKGGAFYSALDADSEHVEGKFYRWRKEEIEKLLTPKEFELFASLYGIHDEPNFEHEFYAPQLKQPLAQSAAERQTTYAELDAKLKPIRQKLFDARASRIRPLTDTKVLTSWNGLMIKGCADAGRLLKNENYLDRAKIAATFILENMRDDDGKLFRTYANGQAKLNAYLDDYAFLIEGLLAIHQATNDATWLESAEELLAIQMDQYWDKEKGGFFFTAKDHEQLLARGKMFTDGARPSGNSISALNFLYLADATKKDEYRVRAKSMFDAAGSLLHDSPAGAPAMMIAVARYLEGKPQSAEPSKQSSTEENKPTDQDEN